MSAAIIIAQQSSLGEVRRPLGGSSLQKTVRSFFSETHCHWPETFTIHDREPPCFFDCVNELIGWRGDGSFHPPARNQNPRPRLIV
jgi:hypothetical protein